VERLTTTEEFWPGQKEDLRTARIETWVGSQKLEVGRITAPRDLFEGLRWLVEHAAQMKELLGAVEYVDCGTDVFCPYCGASRFDDGHKDACKWAEVMG